MNNLKCRHWANKTYCNNPEDTTRISEFVNNPVSVPWMVQICVNNPDTSWGDIICIENNLGQFIYDPYLEDIQYPFSGISQIKKQ